MKKYINNIRKEYREIKKIWKEREEKLDWGFEELIARELKDAPKILKNHLWNKDLCFENNFLDRPTKEDYQVTTDINREIADIAEFMNDCIENIDYIKDEDDFTEINDLKTELNHLYIELSGEMIDEDYFFERQQEIKEHLNLIKEDLETDLKATEVKYKNKEMEEYDYTPYKEEVENCLDEIRKLSGEEDEI